MLELESEYGKFDPEERDQAFLDRVGAKVEAIWKSKNLPILDLKHTKIRSKWKDLKQGYDRYKNPPTGGKSRAPMTAFREGTPELATFLDRMEKLLTKTSPKTIIDSAVPSMNANLNTSVSSLGSELDTSSVSETSGLPLPKNHKKAASRQAEFASAVKVMTRDLNEASESLRGAITSINDTMARIADRIEEQPIPPGGPRPAVDGNNQQEFGMMFMNMMGQVMSSIRTMAPLQEPSVSFSPAPLAAPSAPTDPLPSEVASKKRSHAFSEPEADPKVPKLQEGTVTQSRTRRDLPPAGSFSAYK